MNTWVRIGMAVMTCAAALPWQRAVAAPPLLDTPSRAFITGEQVVEQAYRPYGSTVGDLDGDGDLDLAFAQAGNWITPHMSVLFNAGDGTFSPPVFYPTSGETFDVVAVDLDGDGDLDLAFTQCDQGYSGNKVLLFLNNGDGAFGLEQSFITGKGPKGIVAADFDRDGDLDLATSNNEFNEHDISLHRNNGAAQFTSRADFVIGNDKQPFKLVAGDFNGDDYPDLAVTVRYGMPAIYVLMNNKLGGFHPPVPYNGNYGSIIENPGLGAGDVDADGDLDVLFCKSADGVAWFRNNGSGIFTLVSIPTPTIFGFLEEFAVADVTRDGWPDIVGLERGFVVLPSTGPGTFGSPWTARSGETPHALELADLTGDGAAELISADTNSNTVTIHQLFNGQLTMPDQYETTLGGAGELPAGDLDHDGDMDFVSTRYYFTRMIGDGDGNFAMQTFNMNKGAQQATKLADINGDGHLDVLSLQDTGAPPYRVHTLLGVGDGSFGPVNSFFVGGCGPGDVAPLDLDLDGDLDLAITDYLGAPGCEIEIIYMYNNGAGGFSAPTQLFYNITDPEQIAVGDFDEDGDADFVTTHPQTIGFWQNDGDGVPLPPVEYDIGEWGPKFIVAGDFDRDGHLDVATSNFGDSFRGECISVLYGYGDGGFTFPTVYYGMFSLDFGAISGIQAADVDGDGWLDLLVGVYGADDIAIFRNAGDGTFLPQERYGVNGEVYQIGTADFNGDGLADVAASMGIGPPLGVAITVVLAAGQAPLPGDIDGDGDVDQSDLGLVLAAFGACTGDPAFNPDADLDSDGCIGQSDLGVLLSNFGA